MLLCILVLHFKTNLEGVPLYFAFFCKYIIRSSYWSCRKTITNAGLHWEKNPLKTRNILSLSRSVTLSSCKIAICRKRCAPTCLAYELYKKPSFVSSNNWALFLQSTTKASGYFWVLACSESVGCIFNSAPAAWRQTSSKFDQTSFSRSTANARWIK